MPQWKQPATRAASWATNLGKWAMPLPTSRGAFRSIIPVYTTDMTTSLTPAYRSVVSTALVLAVLCPFLFIVSNAAGWAAGTLALLFLIGGGIAYNCRNS